MRFKTERARLNRSPAKRFGAQDWHRLHRSPLMNHPKEGRSGRITTPRGGMHPSWFANRVHLFKPAKNFCRMSGFITFSASNIEGIIPPSNLGKRVLAQPQRISCPREALGSAQRIIPQQKHQSICANRHPMRLRLQNIFKYCYLDGSSHALTCSCNLESKNEFELVHLRGKHYCHRLTLFTQLTTRV